MNEKLESIVKVGIPAVAAVAGIALLELTGFPEHLQNYEYAKMELVRQYWGSFVASMQYSAPYVERAGCDLLAGFLSGLLGYFGHKALRER